MLSSSAMSRGHERADDRSLRLHREVARRLQVDPGLLSKARERVEIWARDSAAHPEYIAAWRSVLAQGLPTVLEVLEDPGERGQALRQVSPFAFVLRPRERWQLLRSWAQDEA